MAGNEKEQGGNRKDKKTAAQLGFYAYLPENMTLPTMRVGLNSNPRAESSVSATKEHRALEERVGGIAGKVGIDRRGHQSTVTVRKEVEGLRLNLAANQSGGGDQLVDAVAVQIDQRHPCPAGLRAKGRH